MRFGFVVMIRWSRKTGKDLGEEMEDLGEEIFTSFLRSLHSGHP